MALILMLAVALASDPLTRQANGVAEWLQTGVQSEQFATGSSLFDAEWVFGTAQMAALGFAQQAVADPTARDVAIARMEVAIDAMLAEPGREFDRMKWGNDPLDALETGTGHAAWLGYANLALSAHRALVKDSRYAELNDRITDAIARRVLTEPHAVFETYPDERYPVDTAVGMASVMLHDRTTGADHAAAVAHWRASFDTTQRDPTSGLLFQATRADGRPASPVRGSGTMLTAWFLSFGDPVLACDLYAAGRDGLLGRVGPVVGVREYQRGVSGSGDIDSGPIVLGLGLSATGFGIGAARACGDEATAGSLTRTAEWFGSADDEGEVRHWKAGETFGGAPVADAILFAMMSTPSRRTEPPPDRGR